MSAWRSDLPRAPRIDAFVLDDDNRAKFERHKLADWEVLEVLDHERRVVPNRKGKRGEWLVIGGDGAGRCIAVPVERTKRGLWRPITAWFCKESEGRLL